MLGDGDLGDLFVLTGAAIHRLVGCSSKAPRFHLQGPRTLWKDQGFVTQRDAKSNALHVVSTAPDISAASTRRNVAVLYLSYWIAATSLRRRSSQWFGADGLKPFRAREESKPQNASSNGTFFSPLFHYLKEK